MRVVPQPRSLLPSKCIIPSYVDLPGPIKNCRYNRGSYNRVLLYSELAIYRTTIKGQNCICGCALEHSIAIPSKKVLQQTLLLLFSNLQFAIMRETFSTLEYHAISSKCVWPNCRGWGLPLTYVNTGERKRHLSLKHIRRCQRSLIRNRKPLECFYETPGSSIMRLKKFQKMFR